MAKGFKPAFQVKMQDNTESSLVDSSVHVSDSSNPTTAPKVAGNVIEKPNLTSLRNNESSFGEESADSNVVANTIVKPKTPGLSIATQPSVSVVPPSVSGTQEASVSGAPSKNSKLTITPGSSTNKIQLNTSSGLSVAPKEEDGGLENSETSENTIQPLTQVVAPIVIQPIVPKSVKVQPVVAPAAVQPVVAPVVVQPVVAPVAIAVQPMPVAVQPLQVVGAAGSSNNGIEQKLKAYFTKIQNEVQLGQALLNAQLISPEIHTGISNKVLHTNHSFDHLTARNFLNEIYKVDKACIPEVIDFLIEKTKAPFYDLSILEVTVDKKVSLNTAQKLGIIIWQKGREYIQVAMLNPMDDDLCELLKELYNVRYVYKGITSPDILEKFYMEQKIAERSAGSSINAAGGNK